MRAQFSRKRTVTTNAPSPDHSHDADSERLARWEEQERAAAAASRDIADVPAVEVITTAAVHLMSAAAVKTGPVSYTHLTLPTKRIV